MVNLKKRLDLLKSLYNFNDEFLPLMRQIGRVFVNDLYYMEGEIIFSNDRKQYLKEYKISNEMAKKINMTKFFHWMVGSACSDIIKSTQPNYTRFELRQFAGKYCYVMIHNDIINYFSYIIVQVFLHNWTNVAVEKLFELPKSYECHILCELPIGSLMKFQCGENELRLTRNWEGTEILCFYNQKIVPNDLSSITHYIFLVTEI